MPQVFHLKKPSSYSSLEEILEFSLRHFMSSVQFSCSVMCDCFRPHESQHTRPPCPSPTPGVYRNTCPLSQWCHPAISSSVVPFSSCPQSFPASRYFQMSQLFTKYWSFSFSISPCNKYSVLISFRIDWFDLLAIQGTLKSLLQLHIYTLFLYTHIYRWCAYTFKMLCKMSNVLCLVSLSCPTLCIPWTVAH